MIKHWQPNKLHGPAEIGEEINRVIDALNNLKVGKVKPAPARQSKATKEALASIQENLTDLAAGVASLS